MAGSISMSRGGRATITGINVTPMVDVVLVLLVIMKCVVIVISARSARQKSRLLRNFLMQLKM